MKPRTYFRLALLFPYLLWCICALIVFILSSMETSTDVNAVLMPVFFYTFGILLWFIPYTLLAIGLWIWSKDKATAKLSKTAITAPLLLVFLMLIESVLVSLPFESITDFTETLPGQTVLLAGFSLVVGYLCVGIAMGIYKLLQMKGFIQEGASVVLPEN